MRTCSLDIYGVSSQHFDTSLKLLLFLTKLNRAELVVFLFSDYIFAENQNNLRKLDCDNGNDNSVDCVIICVLL